MGDLSLICPLCCNKIFNSKEALIEHLSHIITNLFCPVCNCKVRSIEHLSEHLSLDNCSPIDTVQTIVFDNTESNEYISENSTALDYKHVGDGNTIIQTNSNNNYAHVNVLDERDASKMHIDLMKCLQTQELKFVKETGDNRYIIVTGEETNINQDNVVTKQNKDGTISLTSAGDIKDEVSDVYESPKEDEHHTVVQEYSCSTCQMSFTSVIDHINNYHTDQDVVVEGNIGNMSSGLPELDYETVESEENSTESQPPRRVITDTGDIVETPLVVRTTTTGKLQLKSVTSVNKHLVKNPKEQATEKPGRVSKRYIKIDKLCDSVVRDLKPDSKNGPACHKVVVAPPVLTSTGESLKMYHCTNCDLYGSQLNEFRTQTCSKAPRYQCAQCPMSYDNSKSLCAHMKAHKEPPTDANGVILKPEVQETFTCEICCTVLLTSKSLKLHKRMHGPIKSRSIDPPDDSQPERNFRCETCNKVIPEEYKAIHKASHETDKMLNCGICNKKFTSADFLEMHMNVHNLDKLASSELAEKQRRSLDEGDDLASGQDEQHVPTKQGKSNKILPYSCVYCDRKFARPHEKVKHERIHTGEKPHECVICGKSFRVSYCLTLHMRTHTGARPYACPHCDKRFKAHSVYNHHLLTHSEVRAYKCPYCPKAFKTSVQLAGHKNSHTKPFSCNQCNRPFASLYAVRVHTETHNRQNSLKFRCSLCGASYARAFALKDHIKQVHNQEVGSIDPFTGHADDWVLKPIPDADDKDLSQEITDLELPSDEFIVPN